MIVRPNLVPGFTIVERLGMGGVSGVFRALRDSDGLEVALKVTSLADLDPEFRPQERFEREAELLARLSHPSLPRFHDWGVTLEGFGWLALELVRGVPLSHFALRPAWELIPILIPVAEALATVARAGIVHRDVSPENVLVAADGGRFVPKLFDFGVAKDLFASDAAGLTQHGAFLGKLLYAPPEQLLGLPKGQTLDFRADVYSFGLMTWELFTGRPAISASTLPDVVKAHLARDWPKLLIPAARGGPAPRLVDLVERMTARRREDRPSSWEEIVAGLWQALEETRPVARELAEKRAELSPVGDVPPPARGPGTVWGTDSGETQEDDGSPFPDAHAARLEVVPALEPAARLLSRELLFGRVILLVGVAALASALAFAVHVIVSAPEAPVTLGAPVGPASGPRLPAPSRSGTPLPPGRLLVALVPEGFLEEVTGLSGRRVAGPEPLPAALTLPAGSYRAVLSHAAGGCAITVSFEVRPGKTTRVLESCLDPE
ncbi:MAG TPA: serine/threonine-protein kinase [Thermoanaerobaculia bacterium]|nr:serine/threonine-protein kinase [Thermoanaerobaculia bacterium]